MALAGHKERMREKSEHCKSIRTSAINRLNYKQFTKEEAEIYLPTATSSLPCQLSLLTAPQFIKPTPGTKKINKMFNKTANLCARHAKATRLLLNIYLLIYFLSIPATCDTR
jgi:hypothetical protein